MWVVHQREQAEHKGLRAVHQREREREEREGSRSDTRERESAARTLACSSPER